MNKVLYIFELDGTLALIDHRRPILEDASLSKDERWRRFFAACVDDVPNEPVVSIFRAIQFDYMDHGCDCDIWIWSARSDEVEDLTRRWIQKNVSYYIPLKMRSAGDFTPDVELKQRWLNELSEEDRKRIRVVFDDRSSVVQMYRRNGVTCFQVADGDF